MFLYSLLEVSAQATNTVKWISVGAVVLLLALVLLIPLLRKKESERYAARKLAFAGVCVASSFVLALLKFKPVQYGGSMNDGNAAELLSKVNVDGGLIGGASLKTDKFTAIVKAAN